MKTLSLCLALLFSVPLFAGDKKPAEPTALTEVEQLKLENAKLRVNLAQAQAQLRAAPMVCESSRAMDAAQDLVSTFEKTHGATGYHFDLNSGAFVKNPDPPKPEPAKKDEPKK